MKEIPIEYSDILRLLDEGFTVVNVCQNIEGTLEYQTSYKQIYPGDNKILIINKNTTHELNNTGKRMKTIYKSDWCITDTISFKEIYEYEWSYLEE